MTRAISTRFICRSFSQRGLAVRQVKLDTLGATGSASACVNSALAEPVARDRDNLLVSAWRTTSLFSGTPGRKRWGA